MADSVFSVSQISDYIEKKLLFDPMLVNVSVRGEVTNYSTSSKGQAYFSIKDEASQINCIAFDSYAITESFKNGTMVILSGEIGYYKRAGRVNLIVKSVKIEGEGDLFARYLETKTRLEDEGLFDQIHKKQLPEFPLKIGVITSGAGAAMHDIIQVATRRFEGLEIIVYPSIVQGIDAPPQLIKGIRYFNETSNVDLVIIGRGGGSFEDLFAFNDEGLAREIFDSEIPIVSAVGHEVDYTICDFVADFRAPTPSAAAEVCVPLMSDIMDMIDYQRERMANLLEQRVNRTERHVSGIQLRLTKASPSERISMQLATVNRLKQTIENQMDIHYGNSVYLLKETREKLSALSPMNILNRGFAFITDISGKTVRRADKLVKGEHFVASFADGRIEAEVTMEKGINNHE